TQALTTLATTTSSGAPLALEPQGPSVAFGSLQCWVDRAGDLWRSDGTIAGTGVVASLAGVVSSAGAFLHAGRDALYCVRHTATGDELWPTQATPASTRLVRDLLPGPRGGVQALAVVGAGNRLFLAASDGTDGLEPYVSDGTSAGTVRVADLA